MRVGKAKHGRAAGLCSVLLAGFASIAHCQDTDKELATKDLKERFLIEQAISPGKMKKIRSERDKLPKVPREMLKTVEQACTDYALEAVKQQQENLKEECGFSSGPGLYGNTAWSSEYDYHYNWCMSEGNLKLTSTESKIRWAGLKECQSGKLESDLVLNSNTFTLTFFGSDKAQLALLVTNKGTDAIPKEVMTHIAMKVDFYNSPAGKGTCMIDLALVHNADWMPNQSISISPYEDSTSPCPNALCSRYVDPNGGLAFLDCDVDQLLTGKVEITYPDQIPNISGGPFYHIVDPDKWNNSLYFKHPD